MIFCRIQFSMLSKKNKDLIRELRIVESCSFKFGMKYLYHIHSNNGRYFACSLENGKHILRDSHGEQNITYNPLDEKSWLNHLLYISKTSKIASIQCNDWEVDETELQILKECLKGFNISTLVISSNSRMQNTATIIDALPLVDQLDLLKYQNQRLDSSELLVLRQILVQNFRDLIITANIPLNYLFLMNSSSIRVCSTLLTEKDINLFLKHWMAGLKPELEFFSVQEEELVINRNVILEGIPHEFAPIDRKFDMYNMRSQFGGVDIHLGRGIKATIVFDDDYIPGIFVAVHGSKYITFE